MKKLKIRQNSQQVKKHALLQPTQNHMPYLIFPVLLFILYTAFPTRAFSIYLMLSVLNLLNLFFMLIYEIHKIHNTFDVIIYTQQIFVL